MSRYLIPFVALSLVAACEEFEAPDAEPEVRVLPAEVRSYLLPGQPESIVIQNPAGCYLISVELTEPRSGYYLRDRATDEPLCYGPDGLRIPFVPPVPVVVDTAPDAS